MRWSVQQMNAETHTIVTVAKATLRRIYARVMRRKLITAYRSRHVIVKIGLGAGVSRCEGWLSTDRDPPARDIVYLDATKRFPFTDGSVDYFVAEHVIEHVPLSAGLFMLTECFRALKPDGRIRISTPNIRRYQPLLCDEVVGDAELYMRWSNQMFGSTLDQSFALSGTVTFNRVVREWGHQFLYDADLLRQLLGRTGFVNVQQRLIGESDDPHLRGMELRAGGDFDFANSFETMVFEACKPKTDEPMRT